jgi:hypothetical protein
MTGGAHLRYEDGEHCATGARAPGVIADGRGVDEQQLQCPTEAAMSAGRHAVGS